MDSNQWNNWRSSIGFFSRESETMKNQNNLEPENENNNLENSTSSQPLSIPKTNSIPLSDLSLSSLPFSAMSISTLGSSIGSALGISQASNETENLPIYTLEDVRQHCHEHDAWIVLYDKVYDITSFMLKHPGGEFVLYDVLGHDATTAFRSAGHSTEAFEMLKKYEIGILPKNERAYMNRLRW